MPSGGTVNTNFIVFGSAQLGALTQDLLHLTRAHQPLPVHHRSYNRIDWQYIVLLYLWLSLNRTHFYSYAIGYVTSNFISQLHLQVRVNSMFYQVWKCVRILIWSDTHKICYSNCYIKFYRVDISGYDCIIDHWIFLTGKLKQANSICDGKTDHLRWQHFKYNTVIPSTCWKSTR